MKKTLKIDELIAHSRDIKSLSLNEVQSKQIIAQYGIPVVQEIVVTNETQAAYAAGKVGFPVVLKGLGSKLTHKTEMGIVKVNLQSKEQVCKAFEHVKTACGTAWEGCLIQPMVTGRREFVAGLIQDSQFGPVVMFGLGGIFAEALNDVVFRIAPINEKQALQMMDDLITHKLLGDFRGESGVDKTQMANVLVGLSKLGMDHPDIKEVDINPLIISEDGKVTAVDGLVILNENPAKACKIDINQETALKQLNTDLQTMMYPESIAVIGVPRTPLGPYPGIYRCMRDYGYAGRLYPINPQTKDIDGVKSYPSLKALPEAVDLVILSITANRVPDALEECIATGCKNIHIFTSGFAEAGEKEGIRLQKEIKAIIKKGNLNVIGPNCMGIHVPASKTLTWKMASKISGPVAMISQSGGNAQDFAHLANTRFGLFFSKIISFGNAATMDSTDFLEYLASDKDTQIIAMYLEGVKDGRKLLDQVTRINPKKPVVILKGGLTESGARTVASHTGSLAGGEKIWKGFFKQSGAVPVESLDEMAQTIMALHHLPPVKGRGVAILGTGGGIGVAAADSCARTGLQMPPLTPEVMEKLREYIPPAGNMIKNPIDAHIVVMRLNLMGPTLQLLAAEPYLNMFILSLHLDWIYGMNEGEYVDTIGEYLAKEARQHLNGKPLVVAWRQYQPKPGINEARIRLEKILRKAKIPSYQGLDQALSALAKTADYHAFQKENNTV